jgi:hypothetical protein
MMGQMMPIPTMVTPTEADSQKRIRAGTGPSDVWYCGELTLPTLAQTCPGIKSF